MITLHFLHQDYQSDVQHDFFGHMTLLGPVLAACDVDSVVNSTTAFPSQEKQNEVQHDAFGHVTPLVLASTLCDANSIISGIIAFPQPR